MIRSVRPTDFASFLAFLRRGNDNSAKTGRNLGHQERGLYSVGRFFNEWLSLDENRYTWIDISRGRIQGLISVRSRPSPSSWQVDSLILSAEADCQEICSGLLDYVAAVGGEVGVHKVFLRVQKDSALKEVARQAGFVPYKAELLYGREAQLGPAEAAATEVWLRPKRPADDLPLFHLYSATVPGHVREAEAMTLDEWKAITKKDLSLPTQDISLPAQQELIMEREGSLVGWLRVRRGRHSNSFDILTLPSEQGAMNALVAHSLAILDQRRPLYCLLPEYRGDLRRTLEEKGFRLVGEYCSLVKQLAVRIRQSSLAPARI